MQDAQQLAEPSLWPAFLAEPFEILDRQIEQRHSVRRERFRAEASEWHERPANLREVRGDPVAKIVFQHRYLISKGPRVSQVQSVCASSETLSPSFFASRSKM